jgi:hypothetical protein
MIKTSKFKFIVLLIGASLLVACSQATPSPAEPSTPAATLVSLPTALTLPLTAKTPVPLPAVGDLAPGTYSMAKIPSIADYRRIIFTLPAGWATSDGLVYKHLGQPGEVALSAWVPDQVYADPCQWQGSALSPLDLANHSHDATGAFILAPEDGGLANQALRGPQPRSMTQVTLGGEVALRIDLSVPAELDISTCDKGEFRRWTEWGVADGAYSHNARGQLDTVYMVDLDRKPLVIDALHMPATSEADLTELEAILASMIIDRGGPVETPSPASSEQKVSPTTSLVGLSGAAVVQDALLAPGEYTYFDFDGKGFNVRFTVPAGWTWNGRYLSKGSVIQPNGAGIFFFSKPKQVYVDPCHWTGMKSTLLTNLSIIDFMTTLVNQPMGSATTPIERPAGSLSVPNRWPGMAVELMTQDDLNLADCDGRQYQRWGDEINGRWSYVGPGQRDFVWAVAIGGGGVDYGYSTIVATTQTGFIIDAASWPGTPADVMSEIEAILESIVVGHWG